MPINPQTFKAPYFTQPQCWDAADEFRRLHWPSGGLPVDILDIAEFELRLEIRPISDLKAHADVDALLLGNWKTLAVDQQQYFDDRYINRLRFSISHEIGHLILHKAVYDQMPRGTPKEWVAFMVAMPEKEYRFLEYHANEFAGRLLVPSKELASEFEKVLCDMEREGLSRRNLSEAHLAYLCNPLSRLFAVSSDVIERRLQREKLWPL